MAIKIAVAGAEGKMGRYIVDLIKNDPSAELTGILTSTQTAAKLGPKPFKKNPDVFIDFSTREAVSAHIKLCLDEFIPMVIGVTNLSDKDKELLKTASKNLPILMSPNMSIGVNLVFKLLETSARILNDKSANPDIAITEVHHKQKKDAPSGTAKKMGAIIVEHAKTPLENIQFSSLRMGEVMGDHRVTFALDGEQIEISHKADNRIIFARGALLAAKWLHNKPPGLYDMQDVLGLC